MNEELSSILMYMIILTQVAYVKPHTSYYVTAIVSDMQRSTSINSKEFEDHTKYDNISITTRFLELSRISGLSQMISLISTAASTSKKAKEGEDMLHLSQIMMRRKNILKEVFWNRVLTSNEITKCSQIFLESINTFGSCGKYKTTYAEAISVLINRALVQPVMIVVNQDSCSQQFASMLKNSTYTGTGNGQEPFFHVVNDSFNLLSDLSQMLYKATVQSVTTIILLCPDSLIDLTFRIAKLSAISYSNIIWVTIEYSSTINSTLAPPLLLSISLKLDIDIPIAELNKSASKVLVERAVAALGVKEQVISKQDATNMVRQSLERLPTTECIIKNAQDLLVLVSLRQTQYSSMPFYTVNSDSTVSQLVEDKKVSWLSRVKSHKAKIMVTTMPEEPFVATVKQYYNTYTKECSQGIECRVPKRSNNDTIWEVSCCVGSLMEMLKKIRDDLWLSIELHVAEDGFYGSIVNGKWNGMVGELVTGKADIAFSALTLTSKRSTAVDYGESFVHVTLGILLASNQPDDMIFFNFNFVANVTRDLLLALLGICIVGMIILYATENIESNQKSQKRTYAWRESFFYVSGITFQRDLGGKNPQQAAARVMFIVFAFGMVIIMTTYTATLTAVQVNQDSNSILTGIRDPKLTNPTESFKFAAMESSSTEEYFRFSDNVMYQRMNAFMEKYNTVTNERGIEKVLKGELQAYLTEYPVLQYHVAHQQDCLLKAIKTTSGESSWNVAFQKNSPWKDMISRKILEYKEKGLLDDIMTKWVQTKCTSQNVVNPKSQRYGITNFSGLVILFTCVLVFSITMLFIECWASKRTKKSLDYSLEGGKLA